MVLIAINEGDTPVFGTLQLGYLSYDGKEKSLQTVVAVPQGETLFEPVSFRHTQFRNSGIAEAQVRRELSVRKRSQGYSQ